MPIKTPKRFTDEQISQARSIDLLSFLQRTNPASLKQSAPGEYTMHPHSSFKISNGKWRWVKGNMGGYSAMDFLLKYEKMDFVSAMKTILDEQVYVKSNEEQAHGNTIATVERKKFLLPPAAENNDKAIKYLQGRDISTSVIERCLDLGIVYEGITIGAKTKEKLITAGELKGDETDSVTLENVDRWIEEGTIKEWEKMRNCVFVGKDGDTPKYASQRGLVGSYRGESQGSQKIYGFCIPPETEQGKNTIFCFESPIDAMAHNTFMELAKENGDNHMDGYHLSLGGVTYGALEQFLKRNPQVMQIYLCLDNDEAGRLSTKYIAKEIKDNAKLKDVIVINAPPKYGKDYADTVVVVKQQYAELQENEKTGDLKKENKKRDTGAK